jgi:hypothetical protein
MVRATSFSFSRLNKIFIPSANGWTCSVSCSRQYPHFPNLPKYPLRLNVKLVFMISEKEKRKKEKKR